MTKNIEWLKEEILGLRKNGNTESNQTEAEKEMGRLQKWAWDNCADRVYELINQLDEPEVLSPEWIDNHTYHEDEYDFYYADPDELKNLLVPEQEELEVKIQVLIERYRSEDGQYSNPENAWIGEFIEDLENLLEEEPKYRVILEENSYGAMGLGIGREGRLTFTATHDKWSLPKLTEQEIKDYDERYWPFAVKVEELEE